MRTIIYKVRYHVVGTDHCGYCSGAEADNNIVDFYTTKKRPMKKRISDIKELNYVNRGCTSGGSGYCCGFGQTYIAKSIIYEKKISKKKESESGESESDSESDSESESGSDSESKSGSDSESKSGSDSE